MAKLTKIIPCLWFDAQGEEAAEFYTRVFKNSKMGEITRYGPAGPGPEGQAMTVTFELEGNEFVALNGGPQFTFTEAVSFQIFGDDQSEVDYFWSKLTEGGEESMCGWLKDKFGLSWQIVPTELPKFLADPDSERAQRAMKAMMDMRKIDIDAIRRAADAA
jgi:predicted 3-demethylubiquinone-9 3-methyltransferase (glyoxalase superfamily)